VIEITGDGVGATAVANISGNRITDITVTAGGTGYTAANVNISANVRLAYAPVSYQIHHNPFGGTQYLRLVDRGVTLATDIGASDRSIVVNDASLLPVPDANTPVVIWIGTEAMSYTRIENNTLMNVRRGIAGTTSESWDTGEVIYQGNHSELVRGLLDPETAYWLDPNARSLASEANVSSDSSIMTFLHNLV
jgi:hypothetical protein